jgi:hypothetical protein
MSLPRQGASSRKRHLGRRQGRLIAGGQPEILEFPGAARRTIGIGSILKKSEVLTFAVSIIAITATIAATLVSAQQTGNIFVALPAFLIVHLL